MTLTLQSVSNMLHLPSKVEIAEKPKPDQISYSPQSPSESHSPNLQDQEDHHATDNNNFSEIRQSTQLQHSDTLREESPGMIRPYHYDSLDSYSSHSLFNHTHQYHSSSPFHSPILSPAFVKSSKEHYINPILWKDSKFQQIILPIECGRNQALMFLSKLCQGSKGPCILFKHAYWLTPNEFQFISGRETAKEYVNHKPSTFHFIQFCLKI